MRLDNEVIDLVKFGNTNNLIDTANALAAFATGQELTISGDALLDFYEVAKRIEKQVKAAITAVESYVNAKCDESGESTTEHFDFAKASETLAITNEQELKEILRNDFGWSEGDLLAASKLDGKAIEEVLGYNHKGMAQTFSTCCEVKKAKRRLKVS